MTELQMLSTYLTGRLNQLIAIVNLKGSTSEALTAIRNGVNVAGDDLNKLYALSVGLTNSINTINGLLLSDDTTLDELQEVVNFIKANRADLDALTISNIAGLQDALDGKLPLAGGSMVGDILFGGSKATFGTGVEIYGENQSVILQAVTAVVASLASGKNWQFRDTDLLTTAFGFQAMLKWAALSANRTATFPNKSITVAGLDDVAEKLSLSGGNMTGDIETNEAIKNSIGDVKFKANSGQINLLNLLSGFYAVQNFSGITASRAYIYPDKDMTVAGLDDIATAIANLIDTSPAALDTLNELAAALGDDPNFATTVTNAIAAKLSLSGGTMTGNLDMGVYQLILQYLKVTGNQLYLVNTSNFAAIFDISAFTTNKIIAWRDLAGTPALLDDIKDNHLIETTPSSHTGTLIETPVRIKEIPAGRWTNGDFISFISINSVDTDTCHNRFYINITPDLTGSPKQLLYYNQASSVNLQLWGHFYISAGKLEGWKQGTSNSASTFGTVPGTPPSHTIDFTVTQYFIQTAELAINTKVFVQKALKLTRERQ